MMNVRIAVRLAMAKLSTEALIAKTTPTPAIVVRNKTRKKMKNLKMKKVKKRK
jgi:hypothetical protein